MAQVSLAEDSGERIHLAVAVAAAVVAAAVAVVGMDGCEHCWGDPKDSNQNRHDGSDVERGLESMPELAWR